MPLNHVTMRLLVFINAMLILHVSVCMGVNKDMRSIWVVVPPEVERGSEVTLQCLYDLGDRLLYRVEWYRGNYVFYRYAPQDNPATKIFTRPEINVSVDLSRSNDTQLIIKNVSLNFSGDLTCEVTSESPISTISASANVDVKAVPATDPVISVEKGSYQPRETLRVNCTSYPSHPPATLNFFVNNLPVPSSRMTGAVQDDHQLMWSFAELKLKLHEAHFKHGQLVVGCTAIVGNLYRRSSEINLAYRSRDPIPERVTLHSSQAMRIELGYFQLMPILIAVFITR